MTYYCQVNKHHVAIIAITSTITTNSAVPTEGTQLLHEHRQHRTVIQPTIGDAATGNTSAFHQSTTVDINGHHGPDGIIHAVTVKTLKETVKRFITKICSLQHVISNLRSISFRGGQYVHARNIFLYQNCDF